MLESLKRETLLANRRLVKLGLVTLTWGNASAISREKGLVVIKPSGVPYNAMTAKDMVVIDLSGKVVGGRRRPSSDSPTHLALYEAFPTIGGIVHSHSTYATIFAQACREIPCFGTTHADAFSGPVPITRLLTKHEVEEQYERNTGRVIIERFRSLDPLAVPGVLVAGHASFTWGKSVQAAVENNLILERIAEMALHSLALNPGLTALPEHIQRKHYERKHGPDAYYGQK
ncbi:MAG TPA: L-ribulose-5-phosphate 4-epimerase AraD [Bacteroidota bacterium]|nr:L-ribulose-5-phosphate 4-epimerase AraD [Bacteroidota bacterium]